MRRVILVVLVLGFMRIAGATEPGIVSVPQASPAAVCFTSGKGSAHGGDCNGLAMKEIAQASAALLVQAYGFTEPRIIAAIVAARQRGVEVTVLLDKTTPREWGEGADAIAASGIPVLIDWRPPIAHNKVMVIDGATVITGSFNFTHKLHAQYAQCCNAESLLVLHSPDLAAA
jgi:phosphatidylserine/phosphatidylglycerophosphate/cardiolipin synthase-like enzyme